MTRVVSVCVGATALAVYAALQIHNGHRAVPTAVGATLGVVVLLLLARRR